MKKRRETEALQLATLTARVPAPVPAPPKGLPRPAPARHPAAHQRQEGPAERQPQARAAVAPGDRGVGLGELVE